VIDAPVEGRVASVLVTEGSWVREGDVLVELTDNDPELMARLAEERDAMVSRVASARQGVLELEGRILDLQESRLRAIATAEARVRTAADRRVAAEERIGEMEAQLARDEAQLARRQKGVAGGVASERDLEVATADRDRSVGPARPGPAPPRPPPATRSRPPARTSPAWPPTPTPTSPPPATPATPRR
jgi:adhesin transport system membrane fusion protein